MSEHKKRFTFEKIKTRYELIKLLAVRHRQDITELKCYELENDRSKPFFSEKDATSECEVLNPPCYWGKWNSDHSMIGRFTIPSEWAGKGRVAIQFDLGIPSKWDLSHPEALLYVDGIEIAGIDKFHKTVYLPEMFSDGKEHTFMLHLFTGRWGHYENSVPQYKLFMESCSIVCIDKPAKDYIAAIRVALEAAEVIDDEKVEKTRLIDAIDRSFIALNTMHPMKDSFYDSVSDAHDILKEGIKGAGSSLGINVSAIGHSHIDVAWLWTLAQTRRKCGRSFNTVMALMDEFEDYQFTQSQPQLYDYVKQDYPELFEKIKEKIAAGKWEPVGGMWVEADCNLAGAESLARQFLLGRTFFSENFGEDAESPILWLPDVFGYSANLPQLIKLAGLEYFFTIKLSWNQYNKMPHDSFWWQGLDGTKVLTHIGSTRYDDDSAVTYSGAANSEEIYKTWKYCHQKELHSELSTCFGHGDGGGGPTREMLENIELMADFPALPKVKHSKAIDFFKKLDETSGPKLPTWNGELYFEYHRGTYTSQARNKRANRKSEFGLHDAEFLSSLAALLDSGYSYPQEDFKKAWELVCLNQFHDIIPGSSIPEVYVDSLEQYVQVASIIDETKAKALETISGDAGGDVLLINPCSFCRNDLALLKGETDISGALQTIAGRTVQTQQTSEGLLVDSPDIDAYSVMPLKLRDDCPVSADTGLKVSEDILENNYIKVRFNPQGDITSIYDKINSRELVEEDKVANQFLAFEDRPLAWDAWDIDIFYDDKVFYSEPAESVEVIEEGPLRACIEIKRKILNSQYCQRISLAYNSARLDVDTEIDWNQRCVMLKAAFPLELLNSQASYEIQWGHVKRPTHHNTSWDWAKFESCAQKWVDLSENDYGVSLLNDCKYGHDIKDNVVRITLLRSATMPDPDADQGKHQFTYSLLPHAGGLSAETIQQAYSLNDPVIAYRATNKSQELKQIQSLFNIDRENVIIETVKRAEDGNGFVVRFYESLGCRGLVTLKSGFNIKSCSIVNILEQQQKQLEINNSEVKYEIKPFEIVTLRLLFDG